MKLGGLPGPTVVRRGDVDTWRKGSGDDGQTMYKRSKNNVQPVTTGAGGLE